MSSALHRVCVLSTASLTEALQSFATLTQDQPNHLVISHQLQQHPSLNISGFNTLKNKLGHTYQAVFLDLNQGVHLNALAILAGTVVGGGVFVLHLGEEWLTQQDHELDRYLPWPYCSEQINSVYKKIFWQALHAPHSPFQTDWPTALKKAPSCDTTTLVTLSSEQASITQRILERPPSVHFLLAPRGRGKSFALGKLVANALEQQQTVMTTASAPYNLVSLKESFQATTQDHAFPYLPPDALLNAAQSWDVLIVDEAASIPLPVLTQLVSLGKRVVLSSTDYGYEGSGRGFGIVFQKQLKDQGITIHQHHLSQPMRWGENDPLEQWTDKLLFTEFVEQQQHACQPVALRQQDWLNHPQLLDQAFALLVNAHYQTTPDNKRWMLDDPSLITFCHFEGKHLVAVALVSEEGHLTPTLAQQVMTGQRRPRGHLLPQSLLAHEGLTEAGNYLYWRISRIAVAQSHRRQGVGSQLIKSIQQQAVEQHIDFLGTSFAASADIISFWQHNGFQSVRLGSAKDQASGRYSLMMLNGLTPSAHQIQQGWSQTFSAQWLRGLALGLQHLSCATIIKIANTCSMGELPPIYPLSAKDLSDLHSFAYHQRPYSSIRSALLALSLHLLQEQKLQANSAEDRLVLGCGLNLVNESDAHRLGCSGKKAFYESLKQALQKHL